MTEIVRQLAAAKVRFIVIGGQAIRYAGYFRSTLDWDLFVPPRDTENFARINLAFEDERDVIVEPLGPKGEGFIQTFHTQWALLQFHLVVPGIASYEEAETSAVEVIDDGVKIKRLSGEHLLAAKEETARPKDENDITFLRELKRLGKLI